MKSLVPGSSRRCFSPSAKNCHIGNIDFRPKVSKLKVIKVKSKTELTFAKLRLGIDPPEVSSLSVLLGVLFHSLLFEVVTTIA